MATDWIKWQIDKIFEAVHSSDNVHERIGRIKACAEDLQKYYQTGTLIYHKKRSIMKQTPDELKRFGPGDEEEETKETEEAVATE